MFKRFGEKFWRAIQLFGALCLPQLLLQGWRGPVGAFGFWSRNGDNRKMSFGLSNNVLAIWRLRDEFIREDKPFALIVFCNGNGLCHNGILPQRKRPCQGPASRPDPRLISKLSLEVPQNVIRPKILVDFII